MECLEAYVAIAALANSNITAKKEHKTEGRASCISL